MRMETTEQLRNLNVYLAMLHVCDALAPIKNERIQTLNRILFTRLEELKAIENKLSLLAQKKSVSSNAYTDNPYMQPDRIKEMQNLSAVEKKKIALKKHKKSISVQLHDIIKTVSRVIAASENLKSTDIDRLVVQKLTELESNFCTDATHANK